MTIKFKGKRYRISRKGMILAATAAVLLVGVIIAVVILLRKPAAGTAAASADPEPSYDSAAGVIDKQEYDGTVLAETEDAGQDYVDSTLFLGDSNTARFLKVTDTDGNTFTTKNNTIGVVGMGIDAISSLACMDFSTGRVTMPKAVKILQPLRVIITFGTNNLSGSSTDATSFISRYTEQIKAIVTAYPSVDVIVNSIPPVAKTRSYTNVTMTQIDAYNKAIVQMCQDNGWKYLDSAETLKDSTTGYAKEGYTVSDGLHLSQSGLTALFQYIRTHAYLTEDDRPKPLSAIPTIIGVPDGLIQINPLNDATFAPTEEATAEPTEAAATETATASPSACAEGEKVSFCTCAYYTWTDGTCHASPQASAASSASASASSSASTSPSSEPAATPATPVPTAIPTAAPTDPPATEAPSVSAESSTAPSTDAPESAKS